MKNRPAVKGALWGLLVGTIANLKVFFVATSCAPYFVSVPAHPWPFYCESPFYSIYQYFVFPVNVLTNDLAQAATLFPLSLLVYVLIGALLGSFFSRKGS